MSRNMPIINDEVRTIRLAMYSGNTMRLSVSGDGVRVGEKLIADIHRRLKFALGRFGPAIRQVTVRVVDINGPRGGVDKRCRISVALHGTGSDSITVEFADADLYTAVVRACDRAERAIGRAFERQRSKRAYHRRRGTGLELE